MLRPPGTNTPSMFRGDDIRSDVMLYVRQQTWETSVRLLFFFFFRRFSNNTGRAGSP